VPVGTGESLNHYLKSKSLPYQCDIVSNLEFLREGSAVEDFMNPTRIVLGSQSDEALACVAKLYAPLTLKNVPIIRTSCETAELIKYASNSFLATKVTFVNEVADLCEKVGGDIKTVSYAMGLDQRIGSEFLSPGPGYGGACFPKDCQALIDVAEKNEIDLNIVQAAHASNVKRKQNLINRIKAHKPDLKDQVISILGVTFKADTDDIRESPALDLIDALIKEKAKICLHDPQGLENIKKVFKNQVAYCDSVEECVKSSKIIIIVTEWDEYKALDFSELKKRSECETVFDFRNLYDPQFVSMHGIEYISIGR